MDILNEKCKGHSCLTGVIGVRTFNVGAFHDVEELRKERVCEVRAWQEVDARFG